MRGKKWDISSGTKPCPKCGDTKPLAEFGNNKYALTGLSVYCKTCMASDARARRATPEGKEAKRESNAKWLAKLTHTPAEGMHFCPRCKLEKPVEQYPKNKRNKYGIATYCLTCSAEIVRQRRATPEGQQAHRDASKRWREANAARHSDNNARWNYGVAHGTYAEMLAAQSGRCAICDKPEPENQRLAIDHCHNSQKVRGLLCANCNRGLGLFEDSVLLLSSAIRYISSAKGNGES